jgi:hypothetical protein
MVHVWPYVDYDLLSMNMDKISDGTTVLAIPEKYVRRSTELQENS